MIAPPALRRSLQRRSEAIGSTQRRTHRLELILGEFRGRLHQHNSRWGYSLSLRLPVFLSIPLLFCTLAGRQEMHVHDAPEQLGEVSFPVWCQTPVQKDFDRGVALLHSFAYSAAEEAFRKIAERDPKCAMAHWGIAMTHFHQLWQPPISPASYPSAQQEIETALRIGAGTERERGFIHAAELIFRDEASVPYETRGLRYEQAMRDLAARNSNDTEAQVFYALALLANASPSDSTHARQKKAADILEPLFRASPRHPGIAHYLIHAYDNAELASRGLTAAKLYSKIAPSVPHALHMPSHIFTRLGLWEDSIASNTAARDAAHRAGDSGEELHAMDYLVYAYLQLGRDAEAARVIQQLQAMPALNMDDFKIAYASTAMPIRYAVERERWADAAALKVPVGVPPQVAAIAVWAQGLGFARGGNATEAGRRIETLQQIETQLRSSGSDYWATQTRILATEVMAWKARAEHHDAEAAALLCKAADDEDAIEKLPVTPGPIVPGREQVGYLLLEQGKPEMAAREFRTALANAPGRRGAAHGLAVAVERSRQK
jgi:tetratricopeptide (TPR) repeat protein